MALSSIGFFKRANKDVVEKNESDNSSLYDVQVGQTAWVSQINIEDANMRRRLQDLGIIEGTRVVCKQKAPSGNPKSYLVRGATIAIRKADSSLIMVTRERQC